MQLCPKSFSLLWYNSLCREIIHFFAGRKFSCIRCSQSFTPAIAVPSTPPSAKPSTPPPSRPRW